MSEFERTFIKHKQLMLEHLMIEGVDDPAIFKAIFLAGGPGSGKSHITKKLGLDWMGFRPVNPDTAFEYLVKKAGHEMSSFDISSSEGQKLRAHSSELSKQQQGTSETGYVAGRLGLLLDGTGKDFDKISKLKRELESIGYETLMVFINSDLETAQEQNKNRTRKVPADFVEKSWKSVQNNLGKFQSLFDQRFYIVDNSPESRGRVQDSVINNLHVKIDSWAKSPVKNKIANQWIEDKGGKI